MATIKDFALRAALRKAKRGAYVRAARSLYLQVASADGGSWVYRYQIAGKRREMGLGSYPAVTLAEAVKAAQAHQARAGAGADPLDERRAAKAAEKAAQARAAARAVTFDDCARDYIAAHRAGWKNAKHAQQWENTLRDYASPTIGALPVADVDTAHVLAILSPIWATRTETASRLRSRIELVLDAAKAQGLREGENPARWRGHLDKLLPPRRKVAKVKHHPALPWRELPEFWAALASRTGIGAEALRFAILTTTRTAETVAAEWSEIDLTARTWTIPAARMKGARDHRVPLSDAAVAVLRRQIGRDARYVFSARRKQPASTGAMDAVLERLGRTDITVHGFRSTFRDWLADATRHARELGEKALAHKLPDATEAAYQRSDMFEKRRKLMNEWARFATGAKVVPHCRMYASRLAPRPNVRNVVRLMPV